jgi:hypothetical protein
MAGEQTCDVVSTLAPLATGPHTMMNAFLISENTKYWKRNSLYIVK